MRTAFSRRRDQTHHPNAVGRYSASINNRTGRQPPNYTALNSAEIGPTAYPTKFA